MKKRLGPSLALLIAFLGHPVKASDPAASLLKKGEVAPDLSVDLVLHGPDIKDLDWNHLRGHVVVVDFWGTWCAPCVASIPHINDLVSRFGPGGTVFLSISDEDVWVVEKFLRKKPIDTWIALDNDSTMFIEFGAQQLPLTVLVDREGRIARVTRPDALEPWMIQELLNQQGPPQKRLPSISSTPTGIRAARPQAQAKPDVVGAPPRVPTHPAATPKPTANSMNIPVEAREPIVPASSPKLPVVILAIPEAGVVAGTMSLTRSQGGDASISISNGLFVARNTSLGAILSVAYSIDYGRIEGLQNLPSDPFNLELSAPLGRPDLEALTRGVLSRHGAALKAEERSVEVLELRRERPWLLGPSPLTVSRTEQGPGRIKARLVDLKGLSAALSDALQKTVVDVTDIPGRFDIDLTWDQNAEGSVAEALRPLGLVLEPARRSLTYLVVSRAPEP